MAWLGSWDSFVKVVEAGSMAAAANINMSDGGMVIRVSVSVIAPRCSAGQ